MIDIAKKYTTQNNKAVQLLTTTRLNTNGFVVVGLVAKSLTDQEIFAWQANGRLSTVNKTPLDLKEAHED